MPEGRVSLETAVNAKAQKRKDAGRKGLDWVTKLKRVHLRGEVGGETNPGGFLCDPASLRLCVKFQLPGLG